MAFLRSQLTPEPAALANERLYLRPPQMSDYTAWAELRTLSRAHLVPWEPAWPRDDLTKSAFRRRVRHYQREARDDLGYAYLIFATGSDTLLGGATLSNVRRGVTQAGTLGYWLGKPHVRQGIMSEALRLLLPFAFESLRLHRVEAVAQPTNQASIAVLERAGFVREGLARRYLKINGAWQDHALFAMLADERPGAGARPE